MAGTIPPKEPGARAPYVRPVIRDLAHLTESLATESRPEGHAGEWHRQRYSAPLPRDVRRELHTKALVRARQMLAEIDALVAELEGHAFGLRAEEFGVVLPDAMRGPVTPSPRRLSEIAKRVDQLWLSFWPPQRVQQVRDALIESIEYAIDAYAARPSAALPTTVEIIAHRRFNILLPDYGALLHPGLLRDAIEFWQARTGKRGAPPGKRGTQGQRRKAEREPGGQKFDPIGRLCEAMGLPGVARRSIEREDQKRRKSLRKEMPGKKMKPPGHT